jgi:uncharacterized protein involved in response to NO
VYGHDGIRRRELSVSGKGASERTASGGDFAVRGLQQVLILYVVTGLVFLLLPGTFLGVWNLVSISSRQALESLSPAWIQAHGHAQIYGWIGTFILGIGFYSLTKMGNVAMTAASRARAAYVLWTAGLAMRWAAGMFVSGWRILLPLSTLLELAGFLTFFWTVSGHRPQSQPGASPERRSRPVWMWTVIASTFGFLLSLLLSAVMSFRVAYLGESPALPHTFDQQLVMLQTWGFLVLAIWGFNARWLPGFWGVAEPQGKLLLAALTAVVASIITRVARLPDVSALLLPPAAAFSILALRVWERPLHAAQRNGVHPSFPFFIRAAYGWLLIASCLWVYAQHADRFGGIWGAARHALTVGFISTMVFCIGPRILPQFTGRRAIFSPALMFYSLALLTLGCVLRVTSEIPAYEGYWSPAWRLLPVSAVVEMAAVTLFAINLFLTFVRRDYRAEHSSGIHLEPSGSFLK